jgi:hypothetical protein
MIEVTAIGQVKLENGIGGALADELAQFATLGQDSEAPVTQVAVLGEAIPARDVLQVVHVLA